MLRLMLGTLLFVAVSLCAQHQPHLLVVPPERQQAIDTVNQFFLAFNDYKRMLWCDRTQANLGAVLATFSKEFHAITLKDSNGKFVSEIRKEDLVTLPASKIDTYMVFMPMSNQISETVVEIRGLVKHTHNTDEGTLVEENIDFTAEVVYEDGYPEFSFLNRSPAKITKGWRINDISFRIVSAISQQRVKLNTNCEM